MITIDSLSTAVSVYNFLPRQVKIEPAGISFEYLQIKDKIALRLSTLPVLKTTNLSEAICLEEANTIEWLDEDNSDYSVFVSRLDPKDAKKQDHYRVLGIAKLRCEATQNQIKIAYRKKVLKYHPDKGTESLTRSEAIFSCIQKAYEQLGVEEKRRAYDSVDPTFDESIPEQDKLGEFFTSFDPVFRLNSRFSSIQPVPQIGHGDSSREYVENFYNFWSNWNSWREFSYLDAEDKTKGEDRWERREIEKQNKMEREKRRRKEVKRIARLVELAYNNDPRVRAFKEEDKRRKEESKKQKQREREEREESRRRAEEEQCQLLNIERQNRLEDIKITQQAEVERKRILKSCKKKLKDLAKSSEYWSDDYDQKQAIMEQIERICLHGNADEIRSLCDRILDLTIYDEIMNHLLECARPSSNGSTVVVQREATKEANLQVSWTSAELQALLKATYVFPVGTVDRWDKISRYIADHVSNSKLRTHKEVIQQVKNLKTIDQNSLSARQIKTVCDSALAAADSSELDDASEKWTTEQQKQLETALKTVATSDESRWEKIAELVEGKSKKECVKRYRKLAILLKEGKKVEPNK